MMEIEQLERAEHDAWEDLYRACPGDVAAGLGLAVERFGRALYLQARTIPLTQFNRMCGLGFENADAAITAGLERFRAAGVTRAWFQVAPGPHQPATDAQLTKAGLRLHERRWVKFARSPEEAPRPSTDLKIVAADEANSSAFAEAVLAGFGMPPVMKPWLLALCGRPGWRCFVAMAGEEPVGGATMHIANGIAWLGIGAVRPEHRRKGAQSALLAARIAAGLRHGVEGFTTETGRPLPGEPGPSFANIQRAGFRIVYDRPNWELG